MKDIITKGQSMTIEETVHDIKDSLNNVSEILTDMRIKQARHEETQKNTNKSLEELKDRIVVKFNDVDSKVEDYNKGHKDKIEDISKKVEAQNKFTNRIILIAGGIGSLFTLLMKEGWGLFQKLLN